MAKPVDEYQVIDCLREMTNSLSALESGEAGDATAANQATQITAEQAIQATAGAINGAAVVTDANGTLQQYLRGLVKLWAAALGSGTAAAALRVELPTNGTGVVGARNLKGEAGAVAETGTTALSGLDWEAIQCIAETVIASYTSSTLGGDTIAGVTLPAGTIIYARFSAITLTSGKIIGYVRNP